MSTISGGKLHDGMLGAKLLGIIKKLNGRFGFIQVVDHEDTVFFTTQQFKGEGVPFEGLQVEFELNKNAKGWKAINCQPAHSDLDLDHFSGLSLGSTAAPITAGAPQYEASQSLKYALHYDEANMNQDQIDIFDQSLVFYQQLEKRSKSAFLLTGKTAAKAFETKIQQFNEEIENKMFSNRVAVFEGEDRGKNDWLLIKTMQSSKTDKRSITVEEVLTLFFFKSYFATRLLPLMKLLPDLLKEYSERVSPDDSVPVFAKAAWMFLRVRRLISPKIASCLLSNWVLLQHGMPFVIDHLSPDLPPESPIYRTTNYSVVYEWFLDRLSTMWLDFDERMSKALKQTSKPTAEQQAAQHAEIVNSHRKKIKESEVCFICLDETVKCTVSMLCCGQASHTRCLQQWHSSRYAGSGAGTCPGCRQSYVEPVVRSEAPAQRGDALSFLDRMFQGVSRPAIVPHSFVEEEEEEEDDNNQCYSCGMRQRAQDCSNQCCGSCCGIPNYNNHCGRHAHLMTRNYRAWAEDNEEEEEEDDNQCHACGMRQRAQDCPNQCCGSCCGIPNYNNHCERHAHLVTRNYRTWAGYDDEEEEEEEESYYSEPAPRQVDYCVNCGIRARAQECSNARCGQCCGNGSYQQSCERHGYMYTRW